MKLLTRFLVILMVISAAGVAGWALLRNPSTQQPQPAALPTPSPFAALEPTQTRAATATAHASQEVPRLEPSPTPTPLAPTRAPSLPTPGPTVASDLALEFTVVRPDEFLGQIALNHGVTVAEIVRFSGLENPDLLAVGQGLIIPHLTQRYTPDVTLLPDSELVYGPGYLDFDVASFVASQPGYLAGFRMPTGTGQDWSGVEVVERVSVRFGVGPRVLLALLEARGGWLTNPQPDEIPRDYPVGHLAGAPGLLPQLEWAADELNRGFYGWLDRGETAIRFQDGVIARGAPGLNPGTVAVHRVLARDSSWADRIAETEAFAAAYEKLFGDPTALDAGPVLPAALSLPVLQLPWSPGEWWYLTGGPHGGWGSGSGWAALDFVPESAIPGSCQTADSWARAVAPGVVARNDSGEVLVDLDGDGDVRTGWVLQYLHISDRTEVGSVLETGDPIGRPSCEGGASDSTHLHVARRYNGLWVAADGPVPFVLSGWQAWGSFEYEGGLSRPGDVPRVACNCREREQNGLTTGE